MTTAHDGKDRYNDFTLTPAPVGNNRPGRGDTRDSHMTTSEAGPRRLTNTLLWGAQIVLAALFVFFAMPKLTGASGSVQEFGLIGAGQWLRPLVGIAELAGAIGLLTPWLAGLAAAGLAADMAGATIINATVLGHTEYGPMVWVTAPLCAVFVLVAYGRRQQIRGLLAVAKAILVRTEVRVGR